MWKEPSIHFLALGALLLVGWEALAGEPASNRIEVPAQTLASLARRFEGERGRPPDAGERRALVADWVDEEVLYREALALGLDRTDPIVRRRLIQKMRFVLEGIGEAEVDGAEPSAREADLRAYFEAHREDYRSPGRLDFTQVFFSPEADGPPRRAGITEALEALRSGTANPGELGDPFPHGLRFQGASPERVTRIFGRSFAETLPTLPRGEWVPLSSGLGEHLVRLKRVTPGSVPPLASVRGQVEADFREARREAAAAKALADLRRSYRVELDDADLGTDAPRPPRDRPEPEAAEEAPALGAEARKGPTG